MKNSLLILLTFFIIIVAYWLLNNNYHKEIENALKGFKAEQCQLIRNQVEKSPSSSYAHIQRKYQIKKRSIKSTDDFIRLVVSASSSSDEPYQIRCNKDKQLQVAADWFLNRL